MIKPPSNVVTVTTLPPIWIDLDIDSFNTSRFDEPSRSQEENNAKNDPNHFGKIIRPNWVREAKCFIRLFWKYLNFSIFPK